MALSPTWMSIRCWRANSAICPGARPSCPIVPTSPLPSNRSGSWAGVTRIGTGGTDGTYCRAALAAAEYFPQVYAAIGRHPSEATGFDNADYAELEALASHEKCVAIGETGLDYYRDYAPREDQKRAFEAQIELARTSGKPLVIHTRAADDDTLELLDQRAQGLRVVLHCF